MNPINLKMGQLRMLVAVAEQGNFGKAGLSLGVSQSTISHAIASLEDELGVVLIRRGRHGAHLTSVGEQILHYARQMLDLSEAIAQTANTARGLNGGTISIASFRSFATHVLPPVLAQFREQYPNVKIKLTELYLQQDVERAIRDGQADIGVMHLPVQSGFDAWELFRDEYKVFIPRGVSFPSNSVTWDDLIRYPIILPPPDDTCSRIVRDHFAHHHQPLNVMYEIKEASTAISMVSQGLGIAILANLVAQPVPATVQAYSLPIKLERLAGVAVCSNALHSPAVYAFLDTLRQRYSPHSPQLA